MLVSTASGIQPPKDLCGKKADTITITQMCIVWTWAWVMMKGLQRRPCGLVVTAVSRLATGW